MNIYSEHSFTRSDTHCHGSPFPLWNCVRQHRHHGAASSYLTARGSLRGAALIRGRKQNVFLIRFRRPHLFQASIGVIMSYYVKELPTAFGARWGLFSGLALPRNLADEILQLQCSESEAKREAEEEHRLSIQKASDQGADVCAERWFVPSESHGPMMAICSESAVEEAAKSHLLAITDGESKDRVKKLMKALRKKGGERKLAPVPPDWKDALSRLSSDFPNFEEVIQHVRACCALAERCGGRLSLPPILLDGPPGVGKSYFAEELARLLGGGFRRIGFETAQENSALSGSASYWSNTKPGQVFEALLFGEFANPVFIVEEIEKASAAYCDPLNALLSLIEPTSARQFADLSFPWLKIDASRIVWICTSNDAPILPAPIRSRLICFNIPAPTKQQARGLIANIFEKMTSELGLPANSIALSEQAVEALVGATPREIRLAIQGGIARTILRGGNVVNLKDVEMNKGSPEISIGFVQLEG